MTGDLLDRIIDEIHARKLEAQAAYEETQQLERALTALDRDAQRDEPRRSQAAGSKRGRARKPERGRARRGANREAILAAVRERPGATAREIADATGVARTTVASSVTRLAANGTLRREELPGGGVGFRVG